MNRLFDKYVQNTMNFRIIQTLMRYPNRWMTAADIVRLCGHKTARAVSHKLIHLIDELPDIECRYNPNTASPLVSVLMGRIGS